MDSQEQILSGHMQIKAHLEIMAPKMKWRKNKTAWKLSKNLKKLAYQITTYNNFAGLVERDNKKNKMMAF